jgi:hypothetical protein
MAAFLMLFTQCFQLVLGTFEFTASTPLRPKILHRPFPRRHPPAALQAGTPPQDRLAVPVPGVDDIKALTTALAATQAFARVLLVLGLNVLSLGFLAHGD